MKIPPKGMRQMMKADMKADKVEKKFPDSKFPPAKMPKPGMPMKKGK
jgi:hypothetical protein